MLNECYLPDVEVHESSILACPRCRGNLVSGQISGQSACRCAGCGAEFPVVAGIPRLADSATARDPRIAAEWQAQHHAHEMYRDHRSIANQWEEQVLPRFVELLDGVKGSVLDVGCGVGVLGRAIHRTGNHAGLELHGLDFQGELLADAGQGYVSLIEGDVHRLPVKDGSLAAVVTLNALHHVAEPDVALAEIARILRPGGMFIAFDPRHLTPIEVAKKIVRRGHVAFTDDHKAFRPDEYRQLVERAGLTIDRLVSVDPLAPLVATGLDMLRMGRLGMARPLARALVAVDRAIERLTPGGDLGLMLLAVARK